MPKLSALLIRVLLSRAAGFMLAAAFAILNESMAPAEYDAASPASFAVALFGPTSAWIQRAHVIDVACGVMLGVWALGAADTLLEYLGFGEDSHAPPALEEPPAAAPLVVAPVKAKQSPRASSRDRALQSRGQRQRVGSASPRRRSAKSNMPSPGTDAETSAVVQSSAAAAAAADMIVARRRAFAFLVSITMHAMAEGLGMGVACAGQSGEAHGQSYTIAMSLHNVPEGAAVTTVLLARGFTPLQAMLANVLHCLPQVLLSVPAFLFVVRRQVTGFYVCFQVSIHFRLSKLCHCAFF